MSRSRDIGTAAETAVVHYLQAHGWPYAERRALRGGHDAGDITGTPGVCWEVKGGRAAEEAGDVTIDRWLRETRHEAEHAHAAWAVLVVKRAGYGARRVGDWWAVTPMKDLMLMLDPDPPPAPAQRGTPLAESAVRLTLASMCHVLTYAGYGEGDAS